MPSAAASLAAAAIKKFDPEERHSYTDRGNAERFYKAHKHDVVFVSDEKVWRYYDGARWIEDKLNRVPEYAQQVGAKIWDEILYITDPKEKFICSQWAMITEKRNNYTVMLDRAKSLMTVRQDIFDSDPMLLNCLNGTVDLRTGDLLPHNPDDRITKLAPFNFDPKAKCPRWLEHLDTVQPNPVMVLFLKRAFGYTATGMASERKLFFPFGSGANGKSITLNAVKEVLGDYAMAASPTLLSKNKDRTVDKRALAELRGFRYVTAIDQQEAGAYISEATVKMVASNDPVTGVRLYCRQETFDPSHTLWLSANSKPLVRDTDNGVWDRLMQVPFSVRIPDDEIDLNINLKLREEYEGILAWIVAGAVEWHTNGLDPPDEVLEATKAYREEMDVLGEFLRDCTVDDSTAETPIKELYVRYEDWAKEVGQKTPWKRRAVLHNIVGREGYSEKRTAKERGIVVGLRVKLGPSLMGDSVDDE